MSILEGYLLDFDQYKANLSQVGKSGIPYLYMFALDDTIIQPGMRPTSMDALGVADQDIRNDPEGSCLSDDQFQDTALHRVIRFTRGSHRLQFTRPETVMKEIVSLLSALKQK
ncbi:uncharacterized protein [Diadema antillarum]|uniref:uncharacterized protein n=1 Tax=Diadema antillarum TaxID=105358 RepID=UPI003A8A491E